jgi:DNA-directed RNA polymerase subunit alpha
MSKTSQPDPSLWTRPEALPADVIQRALARAEVAMLHGNKEEALLAMHDAFVEAGDEPITATSPIARLDIPSRLLSILETSQITLVGHLLEMTWDQLLQTRSVGSKGATQVVLALRKVGFKLRRPMCHGVPKWAVDLKAGAA